MINNIDTILDEYKRELVNLYNAVLAGFSNVECYDALNGNRTAANGLEIDIYVVRNEDGEYELAEFEPKEKHATLRVSWGNWFDGVMEPVSSLTEDDVEEQACNYVDAGADVIESEIERQLAA